MVFVAAADVIHSLSRQISESEIYPTVQEFYRSLSTLTSALLRQTIRRFGNHCLWFQWSAVRKLWRLFLHIGRVGAQEKGSVFPHNTSECDFMCFPGILVAKSNIDWSWLARRVQHEACHPALVHHRHLELSQFLVNRIPESSGKVFCCRNKLAVPYYAIAMCASKHTSCRTWPLAGGEGGRKYSPFAATCVIFPCWIHYAAKKAQWWQSSALPSKIAPWRNWLLVPFQFGRLRRLSTWRNAESRGHSSRATGASQKSAVCEGYVHQVCRLRSGVQKGRTPSLRVWMVDELRAPSG